jgi:hypothetical protein
LDVVASPLCVSGLKEAAYICQARTFSAFARFASQQREQVEIVRPPVGRAAENLASEIAGGGEELDQ